MRKFKKFLAMLFVFSLSLCTGNMAIVALTIISKPDNDTTTTSISQPFPVSAGGSNHFRIPSMVTLNNGTLIAAADARWDKAYDGGGNDTIVAVSTDNGSSWTRTFANYMGDNGNVYNQYSSTFVDPALATDGTTAYMIVDLFPAGVALGNTAYSPVIGKNGFDENENLILRDATKDDPAFGETGYNTAAAEATYGYYLNLKTLKLYAYGVDGAEDTLVEGYEVDAYFNIKSTDQDSDNAINSNLFFSDSPFQPYPTSYLYLTSSTDGLNWSEPQLLNLQKDDELSFIIGPGNGIYDQENSRLIFNAYGFTTAAYQRTSLIWRNSDGSWERSEDATVDTLSSEASSVILADGTVRCFYRDSFSYLRYTDFKWDSEKYVRDSNTTEVTTKATKTTNVQLSAILYSKKIDGKDAIILSTPNGEGSSRANGCIYTFLVNEDNSMKLTYCYNVPEENDSAYYGYSCLTELNNGSIGLIAERRYASYIKYYTLSISDIISDDTIISETINELPDPAPNLVEESFNDYETSSAFEIANNEKEGDNAALTSWYSTSKYYYGDVFPTYDPIDTETDLSKKK